MNSSIRPKKSLGQNFLKDPYYLQKIVDAAGIGPGDRVLEIGPGLGHLTEYLSKRAEQVLALELDDRLIAHLRKEFEEAGNVRIIHADALEYDYASLTGTWKVTANLPYYISTPLIQRLLASRRLFSSLTLMLQKEVADRIAADPGGKEYGYLSVLVQMYSQPRKEFAVPPGAFTPRPDVDSAVVTLVLQNHPAIAGRNIEEQLIRIVKAAFSQRRKTLRNSLKQLDLPADRMASVHEKTGIDLGRRAETLSIDEFGRLAEFLFGSD